jgi:hypothetical protein
MSLTIFLLTNVAMGDGGTFVWSTQLRVMPCSIGERVGDGGHSVLSSADISALGL